MANTINWLCYGVLLILLEDGACYQPINEFVGIRKPCGTPRIPFSLGHYGIAGDSRRFPVNPWYMNNIGQYNNEILRRVLPAPNRMLEYPHNIHNDAMLQRARNKMINDLITRRTLPLPNRMLKNEHNILNAPNLNREFPTRNWVIKDAIARGVLPVRNTTLKYPHNLHNADMLRRALLARNDAILRGVLPKQNRILKDPHKILNPPIPYGDIHRRNIMVNNPPNILNDDILDGSHITPVLIQNMLHELGTSNDRRLNNLKNIKPKITSAKQNINEVPHMQVNNMKYINNLPLDSNNFERSAKLIPFEIVRKIANDPNGKTFSSYTTSDENTSNYHNWNWDSTNGVNTHSTDQWTSANNNLSPQQILTKQGDGPSQFNQQQIPAWNLPHINKNGPNQFGVYKQQQKPQNPAWNWTPKGEGSATAKIPQNLQTELVQFIKDIIQKKQMNIVSPTLLDCISKYPNEKREYLLNNIFQQNGISSTKHVNPKIISQLLNLIAQEKTNTPITDVPLPVLELLLQLSGSQNVGKPMLDWTNTNKQTDMLQLFMKIVKENGGKVIPENLRIWILGLPKGEKIIEYLQLPGDIKCSEKGYRRVHCIKTVEKMIDL